MNAVALLLLATTAVKAIPQAAVDRPQVLASFESDKAHGARWQAVNDPVMGGISESSFKVEGNRGVWSGEVKVVPRLHAPGFCRINGALSAGPTDLSQSTGLIFDVSGTGDPAETMMAQIETGRSNFRGQFVANITGISAETGSHFVAFSAFRPFGIRPEAGGPPTADQLKHVTQVGFLADGTKGKFKIELGEVSAGSAAPSPAPAPSTSGLSLFEFSNSSKPWRVTDDPVMGGVSHSVFKVIDGVGVWVGEVKTVPKLQAPGTCQANSATFASADASSYDAIEIKLISKAELKQFQSSWTGPFVPEPPHSPFYRSHAYKAPFNVTGTGAVETIVLPMTAYTSSYSTFTGECTDHGAVCCTSEHPEVCPSSKTQSSITEVGIDAQGTDGKFDLEIISIRAINIK